MIAELIDAGRDLRDAGLVSTRGGNLSVRTADTIVITRTGAALGRLRSTDLVEVALDGPPDAPASSDLEVHRAIYRGGAARAVVHAHPASAVILSFRRDEIAPADHEGQIFVPRVPVVEEDPDRAALGERIAARRTRVVVVRTHGSYATGGTLEDALAWTTTLEGSARILLALERQ